ncbi:MAG: acetyl-CoA acetyltransferase [Anaerolineae bacterium]|nr:acetyl-CoA acetyltransferase [Anaerolineae bacterium]NIN94055.1 acetyl-CoA acetyltransferase [Anaerolineae bacterium]NIQ77096.1 acetyl-CoA acetyltransferase [Anaerolineae bacterium]
MEEVAIVGVGYSGFRSITPDLSYKELMYEAAAKAYEDAGVDPRSDVESFVSVAEDFNEGTSIFDEYVPDQIGAVLKPVHTISGDGIHGLIAAYMQILTGAMDIVMVEAHSKASNVLTLTDVVAYAMEPIYNRPLAANPLFIAGMEMKRYLYATHTTEEQCAQVVVKNRGNGFLNPSAAYGARLSVDTVLDSEPVSYPLKTLEVSSHADGAIVMVLASADVAERLTSLPLWIRGVGWCNETPSLETRDWEGATYARKSAEMAYRVAGVRNPRVEIDFAEVDDTFAYKELQHMEALRLCREGEAGILVEEGATELDGELPINPSGGSLGVGHLLDASGLARVLEVVLQLRGEAGERQLENVETGLALGWRSIPTTSGAAVILSI